MKNLGLQKRLEKALPAVLKTTHEASLFLQKKFRKFRHVSEKPGAGFVTEADRGSERIILRALKKLFPEDHFVAEETGISYGQSQSPFRWHIDPLDGTTNFIHGFPFFCISIGLEYENNDFVLGVIHQPMTKDTYYAKRGGGAFYNGNKIKVSKIKNVKDALLTTGFSYRKEEYFKKELQTFSKIAHTCRGIRRTGSAALDLAFVASSQFDGFWERGLSSWDLVAGLSILKEAGGHYSNMDGSPFYLSSPSVVATNKIIHKEFIKFLK